MKTGQHVKVVSVVTPERIVVREETGAAAWWGHPGYYGRFGFSNVDGLVHEGVPPEAFFALSWEHARWRSGVQ